MMDIGHGTSGKDRNLAAGIDDFKWLDAIIDDHLKHHLSKLILEAIQKGQNQSRKK